jgi:hypothetical protein
MPARALAITIPITVALASPASAEPTESYARRLQKDLSGLTYKDADLMNWPESLFSRYRIRDRNFSLADIPNPEPDWILDWSLAADTRLPAWTVTAWVQAIANRTWTQDAEVAYKAYRKEWDDLEATLRPELERIKAENSAYVRLAALADLRERLAEQAKRLIADPAGAMPGLDLEILVTARQELDRSRIAFLADRTRLAKIYRGAFIDGRNPEPVRPWLDDASERALFLERAKDGHVKRLVPRLPVHEFAHNVRDKLRWPGGDAAAARQKVAKAIQDAAVWNGVLVRDPPSIANAVPDEPETVARFLEHASSAEPKLIVATARLASIKPSTNGFVLVLGSKSEKTEIHSCQQTNRIDRIDANGNVHYQQTNCKTSTRRHARTWKVAFRELPPGIVAGDEVSFFADLEKVKGTRTSTEVTATGRWISCARATDAGPANTSGAVFVKDGRGGHWERRKGPVIGTRTPEADSCKRAW